MTVAITHVAYEQIRRRPLLGCGEGAHLTRGTTDRNGSVVHVCTRACGAYREAGDPTWRTP